MASFPVYCTASQLRDVYPHIDSFDSKTPIYGFSLGYSDWFDSSVDIYYAHNVGNITNLYWDGAKMNKVTYNTTATTTLGEALTSADVSTINVGASGNIAPGDIIKIDNEYMNTTASAGIGGTTITIATPATNRGLFGTSVSSHAHSQSIYKVFEGSDIGAADSASDAGVFMYDSDLDLLIIGVDSKDPNDYLIESGEDYSTLITRVLSNASRYFDSRVDSTLPRNQWKDKDGNFDYIVIRTTALIAATFLLKAQDPTNEMISVFEEEYNMNLGLINGGQAKLSNQNTADSSKGIIRDVTYTGSIRPVDTRGRWRGTYDVLKVEITASGAYGVATYSVWAKGNDKLGSLEGNKVVDEQKITGDYQTLAGGLQIRFEGAGSGSLAVDGDKWEIEVFGDGEEVDNPVVRSVKMTRGWNPNRYR
tara:strand:+ start:8829 stop:10091 length:1263 start_codon:yes stop_codon:yes gene_type:complete